MTFSNLQISLESLPAFAAVEYQKLHPRYAPVVLGVALVFEAIAFVLLTFLLFAVLEPEAGMPLSFALLVYAFVIVLLVFLAWYAYKSASVIRYAIRQHDVIVHSGVFWKKETVQPIRRIQHVEQHQGPIDKRFGLYELKLFSAGTGHFTFRIPGLDANAASRIRQFILQVQQDDWSEEGGAAPGGGERASAAEAHEREVETQRPGATAHDDEPAAEHTHE